MNCVAFEGNPCDELNVFLPLNERAVCWAEKEREVNMGNR